MKLMILAFSLFALSGCSNLSPYSYVTSYNNTLALQAMTGSNINVGEFKGPELLDINCRAEGTIAPRDNLSYAGYLQKALVAELQAAEKFNDQTPLVTLSGQVEQLAFSSTEGYWDIRLRLNSSNGKSIVTSERYSFTTAFNARSACKRTAMEFQPAVKSLVGKLLNSPEMPMLLSP